MSRKDWVLHEGGRGGEEHAPAQPASAVAPHSVSEQADLSGGAQLCTTGVDLTGLMTVLGRHLYSTPMVALRELVQNAHDSIIRRRIEDRDESWRPESRITVAFDQSKGIIRVIDTGAGLTEDEIHNCLATVGVGYTRTLREKDDSAGLIGMFGLGFLSAFVLAEEVTVFTTSYQNPAEGRCYRSTTGERYSVCAAPARPVGSEVSLRLREDFVSLANQNALHEILGNYCALLKEPVVIEGDAEALNPVPPPWREEGGNTLEHPVALRRKRLEFARRFEEHFEPICTMPVVPAAHLTPSESDAAGLLWVQDGAIYGTGDNRKLSVFVRGMLLDDDARDLLPPWAGFISGVIESDRLTPTASREDIQRDDMYYTVRSALTEALVVGLAAVAKTQPEAWRRVLMRHNEALLGAALCDERLFDLLADAVRVPTSQGDLPARALKTDKGAVHVVLGSQGGFEDMLFKVLKTPVARGDRYAVLPFLRKWSERYGATLIELGTEKGNRRLFTPEELPAAEADALNQAFGDGELLVPARFNPAELPLVVVPDREAELKRLIEQDEADKRISTAALKLARHFTAAVDGSVTARLYVNLENPAVSALLEALRAGRDWKPAARLLRSLKVILAAGGEERGNTPDVNGALGDFCAVAADLCRE